MNFFQNVRVHCVMLMLFGFIVLLLPLPLCWRGNNKNWKIKMTIRKSLYFVVDLQSWREKIEGGNDVEMPTIFQMEEFDMSYQHHQRFKDGILTIGCCGASWKISWCLLTLQMTITKINSTNINCNPTGKCSVILKLTRPLKQYLI